MNILRYLSYVVLLVICVFVFSGITYAYKSYSIGDEVTYNDIKFYVIKDSSSDEDSVTMLKAEPLTVAEVNQYGEGHVNMYSAYYTGQANDINGYGGINYYTSEECGSAIKNGNSSRGCTTDYEKSDVKYVVDKWAIYHSIHNYVDIRLIRLDELVNNLGYELIEISSDIVYKKTEITPDWLYNANYSSWTMSPMGDLSDTMMYISDIGEVYHANIVYSYRFATIRPVVTFRKPLFNLEDIPNDNNNSDNDEISNSDTKSKINENNNEAKLENDKTLNVNVPNTFEKATIVFILIGVVLVSISTVILIINKNKFNK